MYHLKDEKTSYEKKIITLMLVHMYIYVYEEKVL